MPTRCETAGDSLVVRVTGDLDAATWEEPVEALAAALPTSAARVVVDVSELTFVDSSGIGSLVRMRSLCHDAGTPMQLRGVHARLSRLLALAGLEGVFDVAPVSEA